jgi:hypothetical protein
VDEVKRVRIGNGCGFWGDNLDAPILLAQHGRLDYLTLEYLAELTMSILAQQKQRDPQVGFATDFLAVLERLCPYLQFQPGLKVVTNAGGMNPGACALRAAGVLDRAGLDNRKVAIVSGDDIMPDLDRLIEEGHTFTNLDTGESLETVRSRIVSANVYLGARPIAEALYQGAAIVITGRVADASLTLGPAVHEFGWKWDNWDRLSAGTVAGHLIECGAQATGGLWCNWQDAPDMANVGYPIVEMEPDGSFLITKPANTGGTVNRETVSEQLLYEVGDPAAYLSPDVVADFTSVRLVDAGPDIVRVNQARGRPATDAYKVSIAYRDGFSAGGTLVIGGPRALQKARHSGAMILNRLNRAGIQPDESNIECLGHGDCVPGVTRTEADPPEVVLRVAVRDSRRAVVERFTRELAPLVTSGLPGTTGYTGGRPPVREVFAYWPALVAKKAVRPQVRLIQNGEAT